MGLLCEDLPFWILQKRWLVDAYYFEGSTEVEVSLKLNGEDSYYELPMTVLNALKDKIGSDGNQVCGQWLPSPMGCDCALLGPDAFPR